MRWLPSSWSVTSPDGNSVDHCSCVGLCESMAVAELPGAGTRSRRSASGSGLGYQIGGRPELREAIAQVYATIAPEDVLVHSGAEEAIFVFMHAALGAGDHIVVHWPCYQSLAEIARGRDEVTLWKADAPAAGPLTPMTCRIFCDRTRVWSSSTRPTIRQAIRCRRRTPAPSRPWPSNTGVCSF